MASRVRQIREELYGSNGASCLALSLEIPQRDWEAFEMGEQMTAELMLAFIEITGANPHWISSGLGDKYVTEFRRDRGLRLSS
jgi:hypothetical protein